MKNIFKGLAKPQPSKKVLIDSLVGEKAAIEGNLTFSGGLRIDGTVHGNVIAKEGEKSMLVISQLGKVVGEVQAQHIVVSGVIEGPVVAAELLELQPSAKVHGDVHYNSLEMHPGAVVEGKLSHDADAKPNLKLASNNA